MDIKAHLEVLLKLALVDENFDDQEREMIKMIASANGFPKDEVESLIQASLNDKSGQACGTTYIVG